MHREISDCFNLNASLKRKLFKRFFFSGHWMEAPCALIISDHLCGSNSRKVDALGGCFSATSALSENISVFETNGMFRALSVSEHAHDVLTGP